jgi:hypothetical protein
MVRLRDIFLELVKIRVRLTEIERILSMTAKPVQVEQDAAMSLPDFLRKSYLIVEQKGEATATDVSALTGRSRAIESSYLNELVRMKWLGKKRRSKTVIFYLAYAKSTSCNEA